MLFSVIARDGTGPDAAERRQAVRQQHLDGIQPLIEAGTLQVAGAFVNESGVMCGSMMIYDLPDREAVEAILRADIYWQKGVWQVFEIFEFKRAV